MKKRIALGALGLWLVFGQAVSPSAGPVGSPLMKSVTPAAASARSIYGRWLHEHFSAQAGTPVLAAAPGLSAGLSIHQLEVSSDTASGRYRQRDPVVTRFATGRGLVFWVDERDGTGRIYARAFDPGTSPLAPEFTLFSDQVERDPSSLACAGDGRTCVLSWLNAQPYSIRTAFVDSFGVVQFELTANQSTSPPFLAAPAAARLFRGPFLTVWEEYRVGWRIVGQAFDSAGTPQGVNLLMDGTADTLLKASPAVAGDTSGGYLLAWTQGDNTRSDIFVRLFDTLHTAKGSAFAITSPTGMESNLLPTVTYVESGDHFNVVYVQTDSPADSTTLWLRSIARDGTLLDSARALPAGPYPWAPHSARSGIGNVLYTERYDNQSEIRSLVLDAAGAVLDSTETISSALTRERAGVSSSTGSDTLTVVWQDRVTGDQDIHGLARSGGQTVSSESTLHSEGPGGQQTEADVAGRLGGGVYVVYADGQTGGDIAMADVDEGGTILARRRVSDDGLQASQYDPHVASTGTGWTFITWTDERTDWPGPAVHAAGRFAQAGIFVDSAFPLSASTAANYQGKTQVAMRNDKSSAAVWIDDRGGSLRSYLRRFDATGAPQGAEVALEDGSQSQLLIAFEQDPVVSYDSGGTIWTVWSAKDVISDSFFVLAQAWSGSGVRKGTNIVLANAGPSDSPVAFDAASQGDGRLRLVWFDALSASPAVRTALFDTTGAVLEGPLQVSGTPISAQDPCLATDASGRWAAGWSQTSGTAEDMVWRRFDALGTPTAPVEQISGVVPAARRRAGALAYAGSYLYGAWHDNEIPGKGFDVRLSSLLKASAAVELDESLRPESFTLFPNYPNPFNAGTRIDYTLMQPADVDLTIFDVLGRRVKILVRGPQSPGLHFLAWDGRDERGEALASGVYFYRLKAGAHTDTRKMLYLK